MRIAVTGASGFVGGYVANFLARRGHDVTSFGRRAPSRATDFLPAYRAWDFTTGPIDGGGFDAVVHCGAAVGDWGSEATFTRTNVDGTSAVLDAFVDAHRFVHISSSSVYSDAVVKKAISEGAGVGDCAHSAYGRSKAAAEALVNSSGRAAVILRPHIVYGPGDTTLLPRLVEACRFGLLPIPGNGRNRVSATHVENLASAVECALISTAVGTFNITDGEDASLHDLVTTMLKRHALRARPLYIPKGAAELLTIAMEKVWRAAGATRRPRLTRYLLAQLTEEHTLDISRARKELGYAPKWTYRDGPLT